MFRRIVVSQQSVMSYREEIRYGTNKAGAL